MTQDWVGKHLTEDDCSILQVARIPPRLHKGEVELAKTRWFPIRRMHPVRATYLYAACYDQAFRDCVAATRDINEATEVVPFSPADIFESRDLISMWQARRAADEIGVRYDFALRWAMRRFADLGWRHLPRPNHLFSEHLILDLKDAWDEECRWRLQLVDDQEFLATDTPERRAYQTWLLDQLKLRENPTTGLGTLVYRYKLVPEALAEAAFGPGALDRARRLLSASA